MSEQLAIHKEMILAGYYSVATELDGLINRTKALLEYLEPVDLSIFGNAEAYLDKNIYTVLKDTIGTHSIRQVLLDEITRSSTACTLRLRLLGVGQIPLKSSKECFVTEEQAEVYLMLQKLNTLKETYKWIADTNKNALVRIIPEEVKAPTLTPHLHN